MNITAKADAKGLPYAKLSELRENEIVRLDEGFTCIGPGHVKLYKEAGELAFKCSAGHHFIRGQADDGETCIGIYKV